MSIKDGDPAEPLWSPLPPGEGGPKGRVRVVGLETSRRDVDRLQPTCPPRSHDPHPPLRGCPLPVGEGTSIAARSLPPAPDSLPVFPPLAPPRIQVISSIAQNLSGKLKAREEFVDNCSGTPESPLVKGAHRGERDPLRSSYTLGGTPRVFGHQGGRGRCGTAGRPRRVVGLVSASTEPRGLDFTSLFDWWDADGHEGRSWGRFREARRPRKVRGKSPARRSTPRISSSSFGPHALLRERGSCAPRVAPSFGDGPWRNEADRTLATISPVDLLLG